MTRAPAGLASARTIISVGFELQAEAFEVAQEQAEDPLAALATTCRRFAADHPHLYRLMTEHEQPGADIEAAWKRGIDAFRP